MPGLGPVTAIARLKSLKWRPPVRNPGTPRRMIERPGFGSNPGALRMLVYAPAGLPGDAGS